jgi:predicted O-methyltransferase YrrM
MIAELDSTIPPAEQGTGPRGPSQLRWMCWSITTADMRREGPDKARPKLEWDPQGSNRLTIGDTEFNVAPFLARSDQPIAIFKTREMLETVATTIEEVGARNIVELGIGHGGSTAFLAQLARPKKLVAIEKKTGTVAALDEYIAAHGLRDAVKVYYGVDQADQPALHEIVDSEFGGEPLDLVIDDASHLLHETRVSFNRLFPRLRPGGVYMIEDWAWGHYPSDAIPAQSASLWPTGVPLTVLVFELVMTCAPLHEIVDELIVDRTFVRARRGPAQLDPSIFDISRSFVEGSIKLVAPEATRPD